MHIKEALQNMIDKKLDLMRENIESALTEKAVEMLEERKIEIASKYFGQLSEENTEE
jgi:hypothetical protein